MNEKDNIFGTLLFVSQRWTVKGDAILKERAGITTKQWMLLVILSIHFKNQQPTITETAKVFGTSRQNLKQVALSLQKKEFIAIKPDQNDFRIQRISLTGKHQSFFDGGQNEQWQTDYINSLFKGFTDDEIKTFNGFAEKLITNL